MKKPLLILATIAVSIFASCDKVTDPIVKKSTAVGSNFIKNTNPDSDSKKILLEDYTGMTCQNCPRAARTATTLTKQYSNIIVVAVHSSNFAKPSGLFTQDLRTNTGDKWSGSAGFAVPIYPGGIINRKNYQSSGLVTSDTKWASVVSLANADAFVVKLNVTTNYDPTVGALNTEVKATFKADYPNKIMVSAILIEDGLVGRQIDGAVDIDEYDFEHVLRGSINGEWGADLTTAAAKNKDSVKVSFNNFDIKALEYVIDYPDPTPDVHKPIVVNDKNVSVVVFAYDAVTKEVLQVEKVKIRP